MAKYKVGQNYERVIGAMCTTYRVDSIERDTNVSCENNTLHTVHMTDVATGHEWFAYATSDDLES